MAASSTITLLRTMEWSKKFNFSRASAIGNLLEPAITSANTILQTIVGAPFTWRWNRVVTGFLTVAGQQDYTLFNYLPGTAVRLGWFTIDNTGNSQVCTSSGSTGSNAPTWNHTINGITSDGGVVWKCLGPLNNTEVSGSYSLAWIETSSVQDTNGNNPPGWKEMESKISLGLDGRQARPNNVAAQLDDGLGNITFRLMPTPDKAYPVVLTLQQKPPLFTKLNQTWAPIPDEYSHIYNWGFLSLMWLFADDPRFQMANSKFVGSLLATNTGLSDTEKSIFLQNWFAITGQPQYNGMRMQQGIQGQGQ